MSPMPMLQRAVKPEISIEEYSYASYKRFYWKIQTRELHLGEKMACCATSSPLE